MSLEELIPLLSFKKHLKLNLAISYRFSHNMNMNCMARWYCCALILCFLTSAGCHLLMTVCSWCFTCLGESLRVVYKSSYELCAIWLLQVLFLSLFASMAGFQMTEVTIGKSQQKRLLTLEGSATELQVPEHGSRKTSSPKLANLYKEVSIPFSLGTGVSLPILAFSVHYITFFSPDNLTA